MIPSSMSQPHAFPGEFVMAEVGVFWDIEDCSFPDELGVAKVVENIKLCMTSSGHRGPITMRAYGDTKDYDFVSVGVKPNHFPPGERFARHTKILEDLASWAAETPPPASFLLIVGNNTSDDFLQFVEVLKSKNYRFLVSTPEPEETTSSLALLVPPPW